MSCIPVSGSMAALVDGTCKSMLSKDLSQV